MCRLPVPRIPTTVFSQVPGGSTPKTGAPAATAAQGGVRERGGSESGGGAGKAEELVDARALGRVLVT